MQYRKLGSSDLEVSVISFGCMSLPPDQAAANTLLQHALEQGVNFFDTADLYQKGLNEEMVGKALKGRRSELIIASKVGNRWRSDGSGWDWTPRKAYILEAVRESLGRLQTDYIDLYQLHGGTIEDPIDEVIEAFELLKEQGLIRAYGISSIRPNVIREYIQRSNIDSVMMQYSLLDRRPEESCLDALAENTIGVVVRGGLAKGLLSTKAPRNYLHHTSEQLEAIQHTLHSLSSPTQSPAQIALRYCLNHPAVSTIACGGSQVAQISENTQTPNTPALSKASLKRLQNEIPAAVYDKHR